MQTQLSQKAGLMRLLTVLLCALAAAASAAAPAAHADIIARSSGGFTVRVETDLPVEPAAVYAALLRPAAWWAPAHTWSGEPANLSLKGKSGACFCEALPQHGSVEHMRVVFADPSKLLRMTGALGPLQAMPVTGVMSWEMTPQGQGTRLTWTYAIGGAGPNDWAEIAPAVDAVLREQVDRFSKLVRTGSPQ